MEWARIGDYDEEAITFFADGKPIKSYRVRDLVDLPYFLPHTVSHYEWQRPVTATPVMLKSMDGVELPFQAGVIFDELAHTMILETMQGDKFIFDLNTGKIISSKRPFRIILIILITFLLLIFILFIFWLKRKSKIAT